MGGEQIRLGLVGYGEIGSTLGLGLKRQGLANIVSYDKYAFGGPYAELIQKRAKEAGVSLVGSPKNLAEEADFIFGVTPGSASIESANAFSQCLRNHHIFIDLASATPTIKTRIAAILHQTGAVVGDGSILGMPKDGYAIPIVASGPAAEPVVEAFTPWGMRIEVVGDKVGVASGIKILRSVVMKGMESLLLECLLASREYGTDSYILNSIADAFQRGFMDVANGLLTTGAIHAQRRSEEAAMSAEALHEAGVTPIVTEAVSRRLRWEAELGLKQHFGGVVPASYSDVVEAIRGRMVGTGAFSFEEKMNGTPVVERAEILAGEKVVIDPRPGKAAAGTRTT